MLNLSPSRPWLIPAPCSVSYHMREGFSWDLAQWGCSWLFWSSLLGFTWLPVEKPAVSATCEASSSLQGLFPPLQLLVRSCSSRREQKPHPTPPSCSEAQKIIRTSKYSRNATPEGKGVTFCGRLQLQELLPKCPHSLVEAGQGSVCPMAWTHLPVLAHLTDATSSGGTNFTWKTSP